MTTPLILAVPKGRILAELKPFFAGAGFVPKAAFFDEESRALEFSTRDPMLKIIRVRSFDVATFVAHGAAQLGICGSDVLMEFDYPDLYAPLDLGIGKCRLSVAGPEAAAKQDDPSRWSHIKIATKYPNITHAHFAKRGVQAECIKLMGAMELAPKIGLTQYIVDLVSSGKTLAANGLVEVEVIADISSRLIVNRAAFKTRSAELQALIDRFKKAM